MEMYGTCVSIGFRRDWSVGASGTKNVGQICSTKRYGL